MKVGDKMMLLTNEQHPSEKSNWSDEAGIPLNTPLTISSIERNSWIRFEGYRYCHPPEKFIPYVEKKVKVRDVLMLTHHHTYFPQEDQDRSTIGELPLNSPLTVTYVIETETGTWVQFNKGRWNLSHAFGKFVPYTKTQNTNKMKNCKIHVPTDILSKLVQEKIFSEGIKWNGREKKVKYGIGEWVLIDDGRLFYNPSDDNESPIVNAKELLGDFDWCIDVEKLTEKQKQYVNEVLSEDWFFSWNFYGYSSKREGLDCRYDAWGTELDWESFVHLYPNAQEATPQVEEQHLQIEQQANMKFKVGDEVEFITDSEYVPLYSVEDKLDPYVKHGSITFRENKGIINHIVGDYYMVEYVDTNDRKVQLGFKEDVLKLKTQTKMKIQHLTRDQLITLLNQFDCSTWKQEIKKLLTGHEYSTGNTKIDVTASVSKLISEGTANQKSAVQALGIVLVADKSVTIPEFSTIFHGDDKMLEVRYSDNPEFSGKSIYLGKRFKWEIKDDNGTQCLVPIEK